MSHQATILTALPAARESAGPHELVAELEFRVRLAALLTLRLASQETGTSLQLLRPTAGLGTWRDIIRKAANETRSLDTPIARRIRSLADGVTTAWNAPIDTKAITNVKPLRDYLSHGGRLASDEYTPVAVALKSALNVLDESITTLLAGSVLSTSAATVTLTLDGERVDLHPFFIQDEQSDTTLIFARRQPDAPPHYLPLSGPARHVALESTASTLDAYTRQRDQTPRVVADFLYDLQEDLSAFSEDQDTPVSLADDKSALRMSWRRATSEGTEERIDSFRLGPDEVRQWYDEGHWHPYTEFMRRMCNWKTVASRLATSFRMIEDHILTEEAAYSDGPYHTRHIVETNVEVTDYDGSDAEELPAGAIFDAVDEASTDNQGLTRITFFTGDAGSGKTHTMLRAAIDRAEAVAAQDSHSAPLYIYVRSTGRVLDDLSTVIQSAVAPTRNLTDRGVKALVRNGLATLLIDGFDELLGSSTYGDAIGSLRPWLSALNGRGTLIVSARSNYFLNEYRESVLRAKDANLPALHHRIAKMLPWSQTALESYLRAADFNLNLLAALPHAEQDLVRLPFFARTLAGIRASTLQSPGFSLVRELLKRYVQRESTKLRRGSEEGQELLSVEELERLFEDAAVLMAGEPEREIGIEDLQLAAHEALPGGLESRPHLARRLPNLCGLGVDTGETVPRFRFQHEVYFDEFFAARVARFADDGEDEQFVTSMTYDSWRASTTASITRRLTAPRVRDLLLRSAEHLTRGRASDSTAKHVRANAGALWVRVTPALVERRDYVTITHADILETLEMDSHTSARVAIRECTIEHLTLPASGTWSVRIEASQIHRLRHHGGPLSGLAISDNSNVGELITPDVVTDRWPDICLKLRHLGADIKAEIREVSGEPAWSLSAYGRSFLTSLGKRASNSLILRADRRFAEDDRDARFWPGSNDELSRFVRALESADVARVTPISASGTARVRLTFKVSIGALLEDDEWTQFWATVSRMHP
ncbi:hypothetical protein FE251_02100 [Georgenia wutianyii]|uniref:NACHT domain-containing protein n=1 Tax=Georgenia wutianyii TaxID=2585135 RepID=A0ABX5VMN1_9MICO|nr:hypothetical protein [Georgenia wutianyii]QDB78299.1 hypothetical protein FE251_02100 [Georgenia wutianyii]